MQIVNLFILDKSGSMGSIKDTIISGFNEQIDSIKKLDLQNGTKSLFGLITFDTNVVTGYLNADINSAQILSHNNYRPGGGTAFYDALAKGIKELDAKLGSDFGQVKVLVTILTDGEENSSREYTGSQVADLIKQYQNDHDWTFTFIGANIDVEKLAQSLNVDSSNTLNYVADAAGTKFATDTLIAARTAYYTKSIQGEDTKKAFFKSDTNQQS